MVESWGDLITILASVGILWLIFGLIADGAQDREREGGERGAESSGPQRAGRPAPR